MSDISRQLAPWVPDLGDGTYRNPILYADYSDPDCIRVGDDYYLTASSFQCTPGLPILHSRDLVNWTLVNHAVQNLPGAFYNVVQAGCGIWAPAIRYHEGRYWIFFPMPDDGIFVTTASHPKGVWSEPHCVVAGKGLIDPCPLWDDDGQAYLVHAYAQSRCGIKHRLQICPMAPDGSRLLSEGKIIADGEERFPTLEGPKFLKRDGWYYILAPAGGVATGWQLAFRSRHIYGPYEHRRVLEQGITPINGPHQGALVDSPNGRDWWFVHFQDAGVYGRIVHLQPVVWQDGWPEIGVDQDGNGIGEPVAHWRKPVTLPDLPTVPGASDTFIEAKLGRQWQWYANHQEDWYSLVANPGYLRLYARPTPISGRLNQTPHLLLQKFPAPAFTVDTGVAFDSLNTGQRAGLAIVGTEYASLTVERDSTGPLSVRLRIGEAVMAEHPLVNDDENTVRLRVSICEGGSCRFAVGGGENNWLTFGDSFTASPGRWIGAKVGIFCSSYAVPQEPVLQEGGFADFSNFHIVPDISR